MKTKNLIAKQVNPYRYDVYPEGSDAVLARIVKAGSGRGWKVFSNTSIRKNSRTYSDTALKAAAKYWGNRRVIWEGTSEPALAPPKLDPKPREYHVTWEIDVTATSARAAAELALAYQRAPDSTATVFDVHEFDVEKMEDNNGVRIDLKEPATHPTGSTPYVPKTDFVVENHGSIFLLRPLTQAGKDWLKANISENATTFGEAVVVEHRFISDIVDGIKADGLSAK